MHQHGQPPLRCVSAPDAPCQPRDKVTSPHPEQPQVLKLKFNITLNLIFVVTCERTGHETKFTNFKRGSLKTRF